MEVETGRFRDVAEPTRDTVVTAICNYVGSTGDHTTRSAVDQLMPMIECLKLFLANCEARLTFGGEEALKGE